MLSTKARDIHLNYSGTRNFDEKEPHQNPSTDKNPLYEELKMLLSVSIEGNDSCLLNNMYRIWEKT